MREYVFARELWLPAAREAVFAFFSNADNLEEITPPWLRFRTVTPQPIRMQAGTLIDYKLRIRSAPVRWRTKVTHWEPPLRFVRATPRSLSAMDPRTYLHRM